MNGSISFNAMAALLKRLASYFMVVPAILTWLRVWVTPPLSSWPPVAAPA
jgi:hypothetical protein